MPAAARLGTWLLLFIATYLAWAWLTVGPWPVAALLGVLVVRWAWRARAADDKPGLPRRNSFFAAVQVVGVLLVALVVGYHRDWVVLGLLGVSLVLVLRDELAVPR